jgi:putative endonuclease
MKCNGIREGFRPGLPPFIKQANQHFAFWSFFTLKSLLMTVFVYALKNQINDEIYVGISADLDRRLKEHNSGKNRYTKAFLPWTLFFTESCDSYAEARKREIYYKSAAGKRKLKNR